MHQPLDIVALVTCAQHGDRQAYSELYEHFYTRVQALARVYLRDTSAAQELRISVLLKPVSNSGVLT
jgi:DNA-directed RNA polymerase specialized sigma24 family protein